MNKLRNEEVNLEANITPELVKFFYLSFKFSQGMPVLQKDIFAWTAKLNLFDNVPVAIPDSLFNKLEPPKKHIKLSSHAEFRKEWTIMADVFSGHDLYNPPNTLWAIADNMIGREIGYIKYSKRINRTGTPAAPDSNDDPYASFIRKYGFNKESTGNKIYDRLFLEVIKLIKSDEGLIEHLTDLSHAWEEKHPGEIFST